MFFHIPTKVYFDDNCVRTHQKELAALGTKALILTGRHSAAVNGSLKDVTDSLEVYHIPFLIFSEIEENPSVETIAKATSQGRSFGADFVIGIGGGSPMDAAKAAALLLANPDRGTECFYEAVSLPVLPVAAIPTTCGTGSEVTGVSVLTRHDLQTKQSITHKIFPALSLIDSRYLSCADSRIIINTSIDALSHCVESYLNSKADSFNRMMSGYGLQLWGKEHQVLLHPETATNAVRETWMLASTIGGMAIAHTGTSLPHAMGYALTYHHHIPHGNACGSLLIPYMRLYASHDPSAVKEILSYIGYTSLVEMEADLKSLLTPIHLSPETLSTYALQTFQNKGKLSTFPFPVTYEEIQALYNWN